MNRPKLIVLFLALCSLLLWLARPAVPAPQNIVIVSLAFSDPAATDQRSVAHRSLGALTKANKVEYASRRGLPLAHFDRVLDSSRPASWSKIPAIQQTLWRDDREWAFWIDADAVFTDNRVDLHYLVDSAYDLIVSSDRGISEINLGVFFMRRTDWSWTFLKTVYDRLDLIDHRHWEQEAVKQTLLSLPETEVAAHVKFVDPVVFNSQNAAWREGQFVFHQPSCYSSYPLETCARQLDRALAAYKKSIVL